MRIHAIALCLSAAIVVACSNKGTDPINLAMPGNTTINGTVISRDYAHEYDTHAVSDSVNNSVQYGTQNSAFSTAQSVSAGSVPSVGTIAVSGLTSVANTVTFGLFETPVSRNGIAYTIREDNGNVLVINDFPGEGDDIFFPGQRVIIQSNGKYHKLVPLIN